MAAVHWLESFNLACDRSTVGRWKNNEAKLKSCLGRHRLRCNRPPQQTCAKYAQMELDLAAYIRWNREHGRVVEPSIIGMLGRQMLDKAGNDPKHRFKYSACYFC